MSKTLAETLRVTIDMSSIMSTREHWRHAHVPLLHETEAANLSRSESVGTRH